MAFAPHEYQLLDFGYGRRLERFGPYVLDRPRPGADGVQRADPRAWESATARYDRTYGEQGIWSPAGVIPERWSMSHGPLKFWLTASPFGHVGVFPEQAVCWDWITDEVTHSAVRLKILNLFAYSGGSTLAAAAAGAEVVHVDSARNMVHRARQNARESGLGTAAIRWMVDDAKKFVERELRRGRAYDALVLDPPSYGHGPQGQVWKLAEDLEPLLGVCDALTSGRLAFALVTCHTAGFGPERLGELLSKRLSCAGRGEVHTGELSLLATDGRRLPSGAYARWARG